MGYCSDSIAISRDTGPLRHRQRVLLVFSPSLEEKPKNAAIIRVLARYLLNGDWRSPQVQHRCQGTTCCESKDHTIQKLKLHMPKLLKSLRLSTFNSGDWAAWHSALHTS